MTTYASAVYAERMRANVGVKHVVLVKISFTKPSARSIYLATADVRTPDGQLWEPLVEAIGPIEAGTILLGTGPDLVTCPIKFANRKLAYQSGDAKRLPDVMVEYEWEGATVTIYTGTVNESGTWDCDGGGGFADALKEFVDGRITEATVGPFSISVLVKQQTTFRKKLPDVMVSDKKWPGAAEAAMSRFVPVLLGDRRAEGLFEPYATPYGLKDSHEKAGGGALVNPGLVLDTGKKSGKVKVGFASHLLDGFHSDLGTRLFIRGGDYLCPIVSGSGVVVTNNGTDGALVTIDPQALRAIAPIVPIDARGSTTTAKDPLNAIDPLNPETFAFLDDPGGFGVLDLVLPNLAPLGTWEGNLNLVVAYSTEGTTFVATPRNANGGSLGTNIALPFTTTLETVAIVEGVFSMAPTPPSWDFGGNGTSQITDVRFRFTSAGARNWARVYFVALWVQFIPSRSVGYAPVTRVVGRQYDVGGRNPRGNKGKEVRYGGSRVPVDGEVTAEIVADFYANARGARDNGNGDFSGSANAFLTNPADIGQFILATYAGIPLASIERAAGVFGSFVEARTLQRTLEGNPMSVAGVLLEGDVMSAMAALARDTHSLWIVNRFTGKHSWIPWEVAPATATYDRVLRREDLLGDEFFALDIPDEGGIRNRVEVDYAWDAFRGRHLHRVAVHPDDSSGGYAQENVRDQSLVIVTGANDKIDWREEYFANVAYGVANGGTSVQVASSAAYAIGMTVIDAYVTPLTFPAGTTITGIPDGTHITVSNPALRAVTYPNDVIHIARLRTATLAAGSYTGPTLATEVRTKMRAVSTSADIKADWGGAIVAGVNDVLPVLVNGIQRNVLLTPGTYPYLRDLAAEAQRAIRATTGVATFTCVFGSDRKFVFASGGPAFTFVWTDAAIAARSAAAMFGFAFNANTSSATSHTSTIARRGEGFVLGRAATPFTLLERTGANRATAAWKTLGFAMAVDDAGATIYAADFRRGSREAIAKASADAHGGEKEPETLAAGWLNAGEMATDLRDAMFDWRGETRRILRFATSRFFDLERGMSFATDASLDGLTTYPRQGSSGSWDRRLWMALTIRRHLWPSRHQEIVAVETGRIGAFIPPPLAPAPAFPMFATWRDSRTSNDQVYAASMPETGISAFGDDGVQVGNSTGAIIPLRSDVCPDGVGGCYVAFLDRRSPGTTRDVYVTRLTSSGAVAAGWTANGVVVCSGTGVDAVWPRVIPDGAGGCFVAWTDARSGRSRVWVQRMTAAAAALWTAGGVAISNPPATEGGLASLGDTLTHESTGGASRVLVADGAGGVIVAWLRTITGSGGGTDRYIRLGHLDGSGSVVSGWGSGDGISLTGGFLWTGSGITYRWDLVRDQGGGAILTVFYSSDWHAIRFLGDATRPWGTNGTTIHSGEPIPTPTNTFTQFAASPDGTGGVFHIGEFVDPGVEAYLHWVRVDPDGGISFGDYVFGDFSLTLRLGGVDISRGGLIGVAGPWITYATPAGTGSTFDVRILLNNNPGSPLILSAQGSGVHEDLPRLIPDGVNGVYVVFRRGTAGNEEWYVQHYSDAGLQGWGSGGIDLVSQSGEQNGMMVCGSSGDY